MMDLKVTLPAETEGSLPGSIILTEVLQEPARSARSLWFSLSLASSIICFIISASFGEAVVVAGAETTGLVTVVGGALGCGAGVCAEAMEAIKAIATRAISAEIMRVFMRMILLAGSMASNKKRSAARFGYRLSIIGLCKTTRGSPWSVVSARWRKASFLCYDSSIYEPGVSVARSPIAGCFRIFVDALAEVKNNAHPLLIRPR